MLVQSYAMYRHSLTNGVVNKIGNEFFRLLGYYSA